MTLDELNSLDRNAFLRAIAWVFEQSPWVAERVWTARPYASVDALHAAMTTQVEAATVNEKLSLLRAHPDLGARTAMSEASTAEQSAAGLEALTSKELERLAALNAAYREKFGFPFIYAVRGSSKQDILNAVEKRLLATREDELGEALRQVCRIARFRLEDMFH